MRPRTVAGAEIRCIAPRISDMHAQCPHQMRCWVDPASNGLRSLALPLVFRGHLLIRKTPLPDCLQSNSRHVLLRGAKFYCCLPIVLAIKGPRLHQVLAGRHGKRGALFSKDAPLDLAIQYPITVQVRSNQESRLRGGRVPAFSRGRNALADAREPGSFSTILIPSSTRTANASMPTTRTVVLIGCSAASSSAGISAGPVLLQL